MFVDCSSDNGSLVIEACNLFTKKYSYEDARSNKIYVEPKPIDPQEEALKGIHEKIDNLNKKVDKLIEDLQIKK